LRQLAVAQPSALLDLQSVGLSIGRPVAPQRLRARRSKDFG